MAAIKSMADISDKYQRRTGVAGPEYEKGVRSPRRNWAGATQAAAANQAADVQRAIAEKSFEKGVAKAGDQAWQQGALEKGVTRYGPGVQQAAGKYEAGFAPIRAAFESMVLPPRGPKRDPRNLERVKRANDVAVKAAAK